MKFLQPDKVQEIVKFVMEEIGKHSKEHDQQDKQVDQCKLQPKHEQRESLSNDAPVISLYGGTDKQQIDSEINPNNYSTIIPLYKNKKEDVKENRVIEDEKYFFNHSGESLLEDRLIDVPSEYIQYTPARVAVGRAGSRPKTSTLLRFRFDHAAAVDAVYGEVDQEILDRLDLFTVYTKVEEKEVYIRRPDLGRRLSEESKQLIREKCMHSPTVQIITSNGLSASAINENLEDVYLSLQQSLKNLNIQVGTSFYAHEGRVGLMDDVGEVLQPEVVINLIGERPGLVSAESMSAYICYKPHHGTIESDRMVISNIHKGGIPPIEAGAYLGTVVERILKHKASGVNLIQKEG